MIVRLINPFLAEICRIDTAKTEALAPGYDKTFKEPRVSIVDGKRTVGRQEMDPMLVPVQVEDQIWEALSMFDSGNSPNTGIGLVTHYRHLRELGLVNEETGKVSLNVNDRLSRILDIRGRVVSTVRTPPGLYCTEVRPISYGIGGTLNLLLLLFAERETGISA